MEFLGLPAVGKAQKPVRKGCTGSGERAFRLSPKMSRDLEQKINKYGFFSKIS